MAVYSGNLTWIIDSYCGTHVDPISRVSENNKFIIVFRSNGHFNGLGFNITYREDECKCSFKRIIS